MKKILLLTASLLVSLFTVNKLSAQGVKIAPVAGAPLPSSMLEIESTDKGILIPRLSLTARNIAAPVATPDNSLLIFNTGTSGTIPFDVTPGFYYWDATLSEWIRVIDGTTIITDDQNIDSLTLTGTLLTTYIEDGTPGSIDLLSLASDASFYNTIRDSLLLDTNFTGSIQTIITSDNSFIDSIYISISDSLLLDTAWLSALRDSIDTDDQNIDSVTLAQTILSVFIENGDSASTNLIGLASDSNFYRTIRDSLLGDSTFLSSVDSLLLSDSTFIDGIIDSLLTSIYFKDSIFTFTRDSLLSDQFYRDSIYNLISDSLISDSLWLAALNDSIDDQNLDSITLSGTTLTTYIEDGTPASQDLLPLASDSSFVSTIASDSNFINTLTNDSLFISNLTGDSSFVDSLLGNNYFTDSIYSILSDSILLDSAWLAALNDSIDDQNLDSMALSGTILTTYIEDGTPASQDLLPLASDSSFVSTIASDSNFINTLTNDSLFISNLTGDSSFVDSLLGNNYFTDSIYTLNRDSLILDTNFLNAIADSIDSDVDSAVLVGDTILNIYEDGKVISVNLSNLKDSSEWVDGSLVGLTAGAIYARKALINGDTTFVDTNGAIVIGKTVAGRNMLNVEGNARISDTLSITGHTINNHSVPGANNLSLNSLEDIVLDLDKNNNSGRTYLYVTENQMQDTLVTIESFTSYSTPRLGIGTTLPTNTFDVVGDARIRTMNDTNDVAGILTANDSGVIMNIPYDTLLAKINDSSEWIDGSLVGLTAGSIYARKALVRGDTIVIDTLGRFGISRPTPTSKLDIYQELIDINAFSARTPNTQIHIREDANLGAYSNVRTSVGKGVFFSTAPDRPDLVIKDTLGGSVGIGVEKITHKLDVNGETRIRTINDTNDIAGVLTANAQGVIQNMPYDTLLAKINDSSEWVDGSLVGLTSGDIYARRALASGDTVVIKRNGFYGRNTSNPVSEIELYNPIVSLQLSPNSPAFGINVDVNTPGGWDRGFSATTGGGAKQGIVGHYGTGASQNYVYITGDATRAPFNTPDFLLRSSDGFIGMGVPVPTQKLHVADTTLMEDAAFIGTSSSNYKVRLMNQTGNAVHINGGQGNLNDWALRINDDRPGSGFASNTNLKAIVLSSDGDDVANIGATTLPTGNLLWFNTIDSSQTGTGSEMVLKEGNLGIGTGNPSERLEVVGNILASGTITSSDERYKKDIKTLDKALDKLMKLRGVSYFMKDEFKDKGFGEGLQIGVIAQEVEKVYPELVITNEVTGYKAVNYPKFTPILIEALKEQQDQIEALKRENEALKANNSKQDEDIDMLKAEMEQIKLMLNKQDLGNK